MYKSPKKSTKQKFLDYVERYGIDFQDNSNSQEYEMILTSPAGSLFWLTDTPQEVIRYARSSGKTKDKVWLEVLAIVEYGIITEQVMELTRLRELY